MLFSKPSLNKIPQSKENNHTNLSSLKRKQHFNKIRQKPNPTQPTQLFPLDFSKNSLNQTHSFD